MYCGGAECDAPIVYVAGGLLVVSIISTALAVRLWRKRRVIAQEDELEDPMDLGKEVSYAPPCVELSPRRHKQQDEYKHRSRMVTYPNLVKTLAPPRRFSTTFTKPSPKDNPLVVGPPRNMDTLPTPTPTSYNSILEITPAPTTEPSEVSQDCVF
eukprot:TRINITY_DN3970_c0_g1_i1.p1 TRINITY_DN3970_c0_g1~~TRINITY_DN3970_c0_g1_i1.p1  ORF type:complete len:155 (+),score=18.13 TRINITY_DN3970_c0_g1_i1:37-501(+)